MTAVLTAFERTCESNHFISPVGKATALVAALDSTFLPCDKKHTQRDSVPQWVELV